MWRKMALLITPGDFYYEWSWKYTVKKIKERRDRYGGRREGRGRSEEGGKEEGGRGREEEGRGWKRKGKRGKRDNRKKKASLLFFINFFKGSPRSPIRNHRRVGVRSYGRNEQLRFRFLEFHGFR
jgi:hypothetical protein